MEWFYKPKVLFGIWVNLIFVLFTVMSSTPGVRSTARADYAGVYAASATPNPVPYAPLPPPSAPSRAQAVTSGNRVNVFLTNDLTLVRKPGRTVVLSPSFTATNQRDAQPPSVTLRFIVFTEGRPCPGDCTLSFNADGAVIWSSEYMGWEGWQTQKIPATNTKLPDGQVAETLAATTLNTTVRYHTFLDIISARRVVLRFGDDTVELTYDQIEALRDMHRRVAPPSVSSGGSTY